MFARLRRQDTLHLLAAALQDLCLGQPAALRLDEQAEALEIEPAGDLGRHIAIHATASAACGHPPGAKRWRRQHGRGREVRRQRRRRGRRLRRQHVEERAAVEALEARSISVARLLAAAEISAAAGGPTLQAGEAGVRAQRHVTEGG
jgi:hypothetical protein